MTKVETIKRKVQNLSQEEFEELREWILEQDWQRWDKQIEKDAATGKLDKLFEQRRRTLKELLLAETPRAEIPVPPRRRSPEALD